MLSCTLHTNIGITLNILLTKHNQIKKVTDKNVKVMGDEIEKNHSELFTY